jgi:ring-1,2-phenylacetyl-CoA epoxidase subunit PaaE
MTALYALARSWFAEPPPPFEHRVPSARWALGRPRQATHALRIAEVVDETPTTRSFVLAAADGGTPALPYRAGQHLTVLVDVDGREQRRCYSFSTSPLAAGLPAITVRRIESGAVSRRLHDGLRPGATLVALAPTGEFTVDLDPAGARHLVMVAGGVGITPLISLAETVLRAEPASRITLLCGHRCEEEIVFRRRLEALAREFEPRLHVRHALEATPAGWQGLHGRLDGAQVLGTTGTEGVDGWFVCGPGPMMDGICAALTAAGVPGDRIRTERFAYASPATMRVPDRAADLRFAASGRRVRVRPGQTVLQAGLEAGVALPSSCTMGGCGACRIRKSSGTVVMGEPNCLSDAERASGWLLACCAYAESDLVIEGY